MKVAGLFSAKPAKMVKGHREVFDILRNKIDKNARYIWFHACLLYTSDIATVKALFKEKLKTMYHTRISYPELRK